MTAGLRKANDKPFPIGLGGTIAAAVHCNGKHDKRQKTKLKREEGRNAIDTAYYLNYNRRTFKTERGSANPARYREEHYVKSPRTRADRTAT